MDMEFSSQTLERELEDIRKKKQEFRMLEERERLVREKLDMVNSSSAPIAINYNNNNHLSQQHSSLSISPSNGYELIGLNRRGYQSSSASSRRATVAMTPRSQSNMGLGTLSARPDTNMAVRSVSYQSPAAPSSDLTVPQRSRSSISALSHPMSRSVSQASDLSRAPHATNASMFSGTTPGMMDRLYENEPANAQLIGSRHRHSTSRLPEVQEDPLPNFGQNPMDFIMSTEDDGSNFASSSFPGTYYAPHQTGDYLQYPNALTSISSSTPSLVSIDSAAAALEASPLTRDNSSVGESFVGALELARLDSTNMSLGRSVSQDQFGRDFQLGPGLKQTACLFGVGANLDAPPPQNYPDPDGAVQSVEMYRSTSMASTRSTASNQERRAKEARERQIKNSIRNGNIMPRPSPPSTTEQDSSSAPNSAALKDARPAGGKTHYQRPKHPKVMCKRCSDHPDGFRGEHELRRHVSSKHSDTVTKWVCRDPGSGATVAALNPLSKCKACTAKKQYGAYYNAAAHLRRAHFRKRGPRGKRGGKEGERRAGKGGGDWPPMADLKVWMRKVSVRNNVIVEDDEPEDSFVGGGMGFEGEYPALVPELTVDVVDGPPAEGFVGGELSPFESGGSVSPLQDELSFEDLEVSPGMPYMEFSPMDEFVPMGV